MPSPSDDVVQTLGQSSGEAMFAAGMVDRAIAIYLKRIDSALRDLLTTQRELLEAVKGRGRE